MGLQVFKVYGSTGTIYQVEVMWGDGIIAFRCECEAAQNMMMCRHRTNLIEGKFSDLVNKDDIADLERILRLPETEEILRRMKVAGKAIAEIDVRKKQITKPLSEEQRKIKLELAKSISFGVKA